MNVFHYSLYLSILIWALLYNWKYLSIFISIIGTYVYGGSRIPNTVYNTLRSKIRIAQWTAPEEGNIRVRMEVDATNALNFIEKIPKEHKITITHLAVKAMAEMFKAAPDMNGKITFGKYVEYENVKITCLVDIGGGKDLAATAIDNCDQKNLEEIADYLKEKATKIREYKDKEHNKRVNTFVYIPTGVIKVAFEIVNFLSNRLGINIEGMQIKRHPFGVASVTSLGMLGIKDCFSPNNLILRGKLVLSVCEVEKRAVAIQGKVEIRPMLNLNMTIDHRYVDGGRAKILHEKINDVFQYPEKYSKLLSS